MCAISDKFNVRTMQQCQWLFKELKYTAASFITTSTTTTTTTTNNNNNNHDVTMQIIAV